MFGGLFARQNADAVTRTNRIGIYNFKIIMRKKQVNPQITHVMADGKVLSHAEFMSEPYVVVAEDNYEFHVKCNTVFDPNYWEKERMRKKWERAEKRRAELEAQQAEIARQLQDVT